MYGMMDSFGVLAHDFNNILDSGTLNWFNVAMYDPFAITGDLTVTYQ